MWKDGQEPSGHPPANPHSSHIAMPNIGKVLGFINFKFQAQMEFKFNEYIDTETVYSPSLITEQFITCSEKLSMFNVRS